jgi:purine-nucleoside phosphorylase
LWAVSLLRSLVTAAAGGLNDAYRTGDLVLVTDHINLMPDSPLRGMTDPRLGERFPDMTNAYDIEWRQQILLRDAGGMRVAQTGRG